MDIVIACNKMTADARFAMRKALEAGRSVSSRFDPVSFSLSTLFSGIFPANGGENREGLSGNCVHSPLE